MAQIVELNFRPPSKELLEVEVLDIEELKRRGDKYVFSQWQRAQFFRLFGVEAGRTKPVVDFENRVLNSGDWLLVYPGQVFRYDFNQPWSGQLVVFQCDAILQARTARTFNMSQHHALAPTQRAQWALTGTQHARAIGAVTQLRADMELCAPMGTRNELLRLGLNALLLRLDAWRPQPIAEDQPSSARRAYQRFAVLLERSFVQHHQVTYYAAQLGMHEKTLGRVVSATIGEHMTVKRCISERILLEARRLLAHTTQPVQGIALALGFDDPSNFVKFFRKHSGMSPLMFRSSQA